jgi:DnaK suppressor protein
MAAAICEEDFGHANMTKIELNRFRNALNGKQAELENGIRSRGALTIETCPDEFDRIQHVQERDLAIGALDRNSKLLRAVRTALGRVDAGTFGRCVSCQDVISMKRLAAVPWTASCIVCQEATDCLAGHPWSATEELLVSAD